ncbi:malectin domain-containing carbohydrate-binding protein [Pollutibacter soli]|uniref:Kelch repeat-containing protein n=1 Tax=Pollutibacter soli TaxID=3034157 RepID=UPI00301392A2
MNRLTVSGSVRIQRQVINYDSILLSFVFFLIYLIPSAASSKNHVDPYSLYFGFSSRMKAAIGNWEYVYTSDGSNPTARHECSYVEANGKFFLLGGRGNPGTYMYDPATNKWTQKANFPNNREIHHFQGVYYNGKIYVICAFTGGFPDETPVGDIYIYDISSNSWSVLANQIPSARRRGAAGAVAYNNKIYIVGGAKVGHMSGWVSYLDEFNPATNAWTTLGDAPHARDHFQAQVINGKMYVAAGRRSNYPTSTYEPTEPTVDVYNFASQSWTTLPSSSNIPTTRAGTATVALNNELYVICGESGTNGYHREVQVFNPNTGAWRSLANTLQGRNGPGGVAYNGKIYIVNGMVNGNEVNTQEVYTVAETGNQSPYISNEIANVSVTKNTVSSMVPLSGVFNDDGGASNLTYSVTGNTNTAVVSGVSVSGTTVTVRYVPNAVGSSTITIRATDAAGAYVQDAFTATVTDPGSAPAFSLYINSGGNAVTYGSQAWVADRNFSGGSGYSTGSAINGTNSDAVYQTERYGNFSYAIPVSSGSYTVKLHFAEIFFTSADNRLFNVNIENGKGTLSNYDIFAEGGQNTMIVKEFPGITVTDGTLNIQFTSVKDNAKVSGIEIVSEGTGETPSNAAPKANAGADKTITLPANSTVLNGTGTDADGTISAYTWTQVSGPSTATFSSKTVAAPTISKLKEGTYSFSLIVTDNDNAKSASDVVNVTVNPDNGGNTQPAAGLTLVNAAEDNDLFTLNNGTVINLASIPSSSVNVRLNASGGASITKVEFVLSGKQSYSSSESVAPYALFGDNNGDYNNWTIVVGSYTLKSTTYINGVAQTPITINFSVINDASSARTMSSSLTQSQVNGYVENPSFRINPETGGFDMKVTPNPAITNFNIRLTGNTSEKMNLQVVDFQGKVIESKSGIVPGTNFYLGDNYPKGVYYIHVIQGRDKIVRKVMKL